MRGEGKDRGKMDGLFSGQLDSLLQVNREQSESPVVPSLLYASMQY